MCELAKEKCFICREEVNELNGLIFNFSDHLCFICYNCQKKITTTKKEVTQ